MQDIDLKKLHRCSNAGDMAIVTYLDQLRDLALQVEGPAGDPEALLKRAFAVAGVPSSTYYRAKYGAELKSETAGQVATVLNRWISGDLPSERPRAAPPALAHPTRKQRGSAVLRSAHS